MRKPKSNVQTITVKGFVRFALENVKTGEIKMSDWIPNAVCTDGFQNYICGTIGAIAGSKTISHMQCATQSNAPNSTQTSASGEFEARATTSNSCVSTKTLQMTGSWATNLATASALNAIALYNTSSGGSCAAIATFTSSQKTTDQTLSVSYQWQFS
jgi:hypothetical protein